MLRLLKPHLPPELHGFVPGREAEELWYSIQLQVELCSQGGFDILGISTDVIKAFNHLPRRPVFRIAGQIGLPPRLLTPWASFLAGMTRRFKVRESLSLPVPAVTGFPEECPLSPLAMLLVDWAYHCYAQVFAPGIRSLSFVDNLACTTHELGHVAKGLCVTQCFCQMLDLQLDEGKTFLWSNNGKARAALRGIGCAVSVAASELGGHLSFTGATHNHNLVVRCRALGPLWQRLRRSKAPTPQKLAILPLKFWAKALHGAVVCPLSNSHLQQLRVAATKALGIRPGGVSSLLRLSIAPQMDSDPGFYMLWSVLRDIRRISTKVPNLLLSWREFMSNYDGQLFHGPFSKILSVIGQVGWTLLVPPYFQDHEGLQHSMLDSAEGCLRNLAERAWLHLVGKAHSHRKTMADLQGIDLGLLRADQHRRSALDSARLASVRAGAFLFDAQHAKYDLSKTGLCACCHVPDTVEHRVRFCPKYAEQRKPYEWVCAQWDELPVSLTHHLLPPCNPHLPALRRHLHAIGDCSGIFASGPDSGGTQHLFTDGSCIRAEHADFALAAWGVIHARKRLAVANGLVPGLLQTAPRAEIWAVIASAKWAAFFQACTFVWIDAQHVVQGVHALQRGCHCASWENHDLWSILQSILEGLSESMFCVFHTPSHLDVLATESAYEDWLALNNNHADTLACFTNGNRSEAFSECYDRAWSHFQKMREAGRALRLGLPMLKLRARLVMSWMNRLMKEWRQ